MQQEPDTREDASHPASNPPTASEVHHSAPLAGHPIDPRSNDPQTIEEERLKAYAHLLDSAIRLPGGFRIGLDGIVGLVPGVGDLLGAGLSGYFIYAASRLDIPRNVIVRMILNTAFETVVGLVPFFGDAFDFVFKANDRNARLLHAALQARDAERRADDS